MILDPLPPLPDSCTACASCVCVCVRVVCERACVCAKALIPIMLKQRGSTPTPSYWTENHMFIVQALHPGHPACVCMCVRACVRVCSCVCIVHVCCVCDAQSFQQTP